MEKSRQDARHIKQRHFSLTVFKVYLHKICDARRKRDELLDGFAHYNHLQSKTQNHVEVYYEPIITRKRAKSALTHQLHSQISKSSNLALSKKESFDKAMTNFTRNRDRLSRKKTEFISLKLPNEVSSEPIWSRSRLPD